MPDKPRSVYQPPAPRVAGRPAPPDIDTLRAHARGEHRARTIGCRACDLAFDLACELRSRRPADILARLDDHHDTPPRTCDKCGHLEGEHRWAHSRSINLTPGPCTQCDCTDFVEHPSAA